MAQLAHSEPTELLPRFLNLRTRALKLLSKNEVKALTLSSILLFSCWKILKEGRVVGASVSALRLSGAGETREACGARTGWHSFLACKLLCSIPRCFTILTHDVRVLFGADVDAYEQAWMAREVVSSRPRSTV
ncbi:MULTISPECIES: hypothetical protein [Bradyrhizobium]|uniref:hypothetical protein n=1 Tax=Bradyrhizobium TaxID=374 RepID=UPI0012EC2D2C|nr:MULTISPECIES: hypothetical protein [Bradyrhizobium]UFW51490.1 hypothetical protein BaraCB756_11165 [Bradyrhizobium arachidis]